MKRGRDPAFLRFVDDDSGLAWAVGGQLTGIPLRGGVLLRRAP